MKAKVKRARLVIRFTAKRSCKTGRFVRASRKAGGCKS
jgi:hypothetical protein